VLHSGLPSKAWLAQARQGQAHYFVQCMEQIGEQEMEAGEDRPMRLFKQEIHNISTAFEYLLQTDPSSAARYISLSLCTLWNIGCVYQARAWVHRLVSLPQSAQDADDRERVSLFELNICAELGEARTLDTRVHELANELETRDLTQPLAVRTVQQVTFCLVYIRRIWGQYERSLALAHRYWVGSQMCSVAAVVKRAMGYEYSAALLSVGDYDSHDQLVESYVHQQNLMKDYLPIIRNAAWSLAIRGDSKIAIEKLDAISLKEYESGGLLLLVYVRSTAGMVALFHGHFGLARDNLSQVNNAVDGRKLPASWEVERRQLQMLLDVLSENPAVVCQAVQQSLAALAEFAATKARAEWIGVCMEVAVLAGDCEGICKSVESYCEFLCPQGFSRCLRIAEALGSFGMLLGETAKAEEFYALANAARRLINGRMLPFHANLRQSVGASLSAGESSSFFKDVELADLSGKRFWELTAPRALELLNSARTSAALRICIA
jgi:hypothetical protein